MNHDDADGTDACAALGFFRSGSGLVWFGLVWFGLLVVRSEARGSPGGARGPKQR